MPDVCLLCQAKRWRFGELACDTFAVFLAFSQTESRHESDVLNEEQLSAALHSFIDDEGGTKRKKPHLLNERTRPKETWGQGLPSVIVSRVSGSVSIACPD